MKSTLDQGLTLLHLLATLNTTSKPKISSKIKEDKKTKETKNKITKQEEKPVKQDKPVDKKLENLVKSKFLQNLFHACCTYPNFGHLSLHISLIFYSLIYLLFYRTSKQYSIQTYPIDGFKYALLNLQITLYFMSNILNVVISFHSIQAQPDIVCGVTYPLHDYVKLFITSTFNPSQPLAIANPLDSQWIPLETHQHHCLELPLKDLIKKFIIKVSEENTLIINFSSSYQDQALIIRIRQKRKI